MLQLKTLNIHILSFLNYHDFLLHVLFTFLWLNSFVSLIRGAGPLRVLIR